MSEENTTEPLNAPNPAGCRWPMWAHHERATHIYCSAAREPQRPYCADHCRVAFVRPQA